MQSHNERLDELLSAFLDGELPEEEVQGLQKRLDAEPAVGARLEELREVRTILRELDSERGFASSGGLSSDFANRVIAQAQREAIVAGLPEDHHVRLAEKAAIESFSTSNPPWWRSARWLTGGAAAMAATLLLILSVPFWFRGGVDEFALDNNGLAKNTAQEDSEGDGSTGDSGQGSTNTAAGSGKAAESAKRSVAPAVDSPFPPDRSQAPIVASDAEVASSTETLPASDSVADLMSPENETSDSDSLSARGLPVDRLPKPKLAFLWVTDVTVSAPAWQAGLLQEIFASADIEVVTPLMADDELQETLRDAMAIVQDADQRTDATDEQSAPGEDLPEDDAGQQAAESRDETAVLLLFVQAPAIALDKAMNSMASRVEDFPEFSYNLAFDTAHSRVFELLMQESEAPSLADSFGTATPIVPDEFSIEGLGPQGLGEAAQYEPGPRAGKLVSNVQRQKGWSPMAGQANLNVLDEQAMTQALFIVRIPNDAL